MGQVKRVYVEKKQDYAIKAKELLEEVRQYLGLDVENIRVLIRYDVENVSEESYQKALGTVFSEPPVDEVYEEAFPVEEGETAFSVEFLPGQFDQRADSAQQCLKLLNESEEPVIRSATTYVVKGTLSEDEMGQIKDYCINPVDSRESSEEKPDTLVMEFEEPEDVKIVEGFRGMGEQPFKELYDSLNLAMTFKDFLHIQKYFKEEEQRDPSMTEIRVLDTYWSCLLYTSYYSFLYEPYMAAEKYPELKTADLAYWSKTYTLANNPKEVISYSVPLRLSDGTVYGVLGIELSTDYLKKLISFNELSENKNSAYILGVQDGGKGNQLQNVMVSGPAYNMYMKQSKSINLVASKDYDNAFTIGGSDADLLCSNVHYINLYNTNTPFADQKWALIGVVPTDQLFSFSNKFNKTLVIVVTALFIASIIGVLVISILITRPVISLASDVKNSNPSEPIALRRTGVKELDELGGSFEKLSSDVFQASRKFAQILRMASIKIGGFEIDWNENQLFMTEDFFRVFRSEKIRKNMSIEEFTENMEMFRRYVSRKNEQDHIYIFEIPDKEDLFWVRLSIRYEEDKIVGLAEDITKETLELKKMEYERDYDLLTNILNRRAFNARLEQLFQKGKDVLGTAALMMIDLDNLKFLNDSYGHDFGDKYIQKTAAGLKKYTPKESVAVSYTHLFNILIFLILHCLFNSFFGIGFFVYRGKT